MSKIAKQNKNEVAKNATHKKSSIGTSTIKVKVNLVTPDKVKVNEKKRKKRVPKLKKQIKQKSNINNIKIQNSYVLLKLAGIVVLIIAAVIFLFTTPLFNVTEIEILGNEIVSSEEIKSLSQIKLNENMFKNVKITIQKNIKGNAYIEDVKVKRILPNKIQIVVQERQVKFMIKLLNSYAYVNSQGYILQITDQTKEVPTILGISTPEEEMIIGKRLNNEDLKKLEVCLKIVSSCEENEISRYITSINVENPTEYIISMVEKNKTIHLGNSSNLGTKILYVKAILQAEEENEGDIFVNGDLNNGFQPYFRKKV